MATSRTCEASRGSAVLYQNADRSVTLIDIPTSIALAQGRSETLLSSEPLEAPIPLNYEPTTNKSKVGEPKHLTSVALHAEYKAIVERALRELHSHVSGPWCRSRKVKAQLPKRGKTNMDIDDPEQELEQRLREWAALDQSKGDDTAFDFQKMMASLGAVSEPNATTPETLTHKWLMSYRPARDMTSDARRAGFSLPNEPELGGSEEPWTSAFHNPEKRALDLSVFENTTASNQQDASSSYRFTIPPRASFFLSDSTHSETFRTSFRELTGEHTLPRHFDLVLLDPPWPNRSAKRSRGYEQIGGMPHIKRMLLKMDIDNYLEHNALVGVWITNKDALRDHVIGPGGLFEKWNLGLIEEWIWVKTTTHGEPMFDIDSLTRKPYEVLLLGRAAPNSWTTMGPAPVVKKRVIAAVPDIHSRKPCLKELIEPYMPDKGDYSALEVFSRYLVKGWMSWGNEVLKYNHEQYWVPLEEQPPANSPTSM
ncbi:MT-A70-domain-containing protein [Byssothecium circinans]|uniref:MT-A70-domain-containing protein n=1 Tax=Byssothecium circinans TaxID=147558 RepID=A0A6A5TW66_9PLEO|nr:MT-A70-domain-containing protein [Byssothecium circinans]